MRMLYNQRKKLHKDTLFFGYGGNFKLKAICLFLISQYRRIPKVTAPVYFRILPAKGNATFG